jgi:hypothetical protein
VKKPIQLEINIVNEACQKVLVRPTSADANNEEYIANYISEKISKKILKWDSDGGGRLSLDNIEEDIMKVISGVRNYDGYSLAKDFDSICGYMPDEELVNILSSCEHYRYEAEKKLTSEWVAENNIVPKFSIGDKVSFYYDSGPRKSENKLHAGEIVTVNDQLANYTIFCEEMGHIRSGMGKTGTLGVIKHFEEVFPVEVSD